MSTIAAAIEAEIAQLRAKHDRAFQADVSRLKADLAAQVGRASGLAKTDNKVIAKPASTPVAQKAPAAPTNGNGHKATTVKAKARRNRKGKGVIKYRDPSNPTHTWTGFGRAPVWMKGKDRSAFAVTPQTA
jgi:DNA-binding protein H-NS